MGSAVDGPAHELIQAVHALGRRIVGGALDPAFGVIEQVKSGFSASLLLLLAAVFVLAPASHAFAYLDPGTGNMILQAVIGAIAGGLVVMKIYWHRLKQYLFPQRSGAKENSPPRPPAAGN